MIGDIVADLNHLIDGNDTLVLLEMTSKCLGRRLKSSEWRPLRRLQLADSHFECAARSDDKSQSQAKPNG